MAYTLDLIFKKTGYDGETRPVGAIAIVDQKIKTKMGTLMSPVNHAMVFGENNQVYESVTSTDLTRQDAPSGMLQEIGKSSVIKTFYAIQEQNRQAQITQEEEKVFLDQEKRCLFQDPGFKKATQSIPEKTLIKMVNEALSPKPVITAEERAHFSQVKRVIQNHSFALAHYMTQKGSKENNPTPGFIDRFVHKLNGMKVKYKVSKAYKTLSLYKAAQNIRNKLIGSKTSSMIQDFDIARSIGKYLYKEKTGGTAHMFCSQYVFQTLQNTIVEDVLNKNNVYFTPTSGKGEKEWLRENVLPILSVVKNLPEPLRQRSVQVAPDDLTKIMQKLSQSGVTVGATPVSINRANAQPINQRMLTSMKQHQESSEKAFQGAFQGAKAQATAEQKPPKHSKPPNPK